MYKRITYMLSIFFLVASCETMGNVKRGFTGEKVVSTDEFLIKKKDPLIMPPDYENLPAPDETITAMEKISIFDETLEISIEDSSSTSNSTESQILKKIQSK